MTTIAGPKVQMPGTLSQMFEMDEHGNITSLRPEWAHFFTALQGLEYSATRNGPSTSRPNSTMPFRYVGMPFFDTDLGKPIFLKTASSNAWVDATGSAV